MRIQTIHRNLMGDVLNECSAQGFQITTADGGRITIMVDGDGLARAEPPSAPAAVEGFDEWYDNVDARFWDNRDACNAAFHAGKRAALAQQPAPSALVGAEDIEVLKRLREALHDAPMNGWWLGVEVLDRVIAALTQHQEPPAAAEPKTLPVPTRVYLTDKAAVIAGNPQRGWDEEGPDAHNCDAMGCATFGRHVLARVPFTDERALSQPAEGEEIMVNAAHDVYTLPLQPSGLLSGPRFVVHVPAPEQQPAADKFRASFRCEGDGIVGIRRAPIHSVSVHDDGLIEVVIDYWPEQPAAALEQGKDRG